MGVLHQLRAVELLRPVTSLADFPRAGRRFLMGTGIGLEYVWKTVANTWGTPEIFDFTYQGTPDPT